jgi:hypothetical protein
VVCGRLGALPGSNMNAPEPCGGIPSSVRNRNPHTFIFHHSDFQLAVQRTCMIQNMQETATSAALSLGVFFNFHCCNGPNKCI